MQHDDPLAELHHQVHVVFDDDYDAFRRAQLGQLGGQLCCLVMVETGGRLIEQQDVRVCHQRPRNLKHSLTPVG